MIGIEIGDWDWILGFGLNFGIENQDLDWGSSLGIGNGVRD